MITLFSVGTCRGMSAIPPSKSIVSLHRAVPDVPRHVPTVWGDDFAAQCRDATCGVRDNSLIDSVEDAWCIEDATLFEGPCKQPRRGAPLGHKRAEQLVPRRGTLNAPWENEVPLRGTCAKTIAVTKRRASPMQQCWVECQCSVEHHVLRFAQLTFWHLPEPFGVAWCFEQIASSRH